MFVSLFGVVKPSDPYVMRGGFLVPLSAVGESTEDMDVANAEGGLSIFSWGLSTLYRKIQDTSDLYFIDSDGTDIFSRLTCGCVRPWSKRALLSDCGQLERRIKNKIDNLPVLRERLTSGAFFSDNISFGREIKDIKRRIEADLERFVRGQKEE